MKRHIIKSNYRFSIRNGTIYFEDVKIEEQKIIPPAPKIWVEVVDD